ncbi:LOW QUALITY PROTEIN: putative N(4)-(beta-N-acetylglucosaminyl)-L-asparaginase GH22932, partial [Drosophila montana]|uniref:LOW QUALITY PROTEIN: putative N(4)-(beta-N-acetylglucosaminyl)-L-asparaginase GH22932 n=1 Tax=Drosophila montana TaxID=40370 RepID=UPI00313AE103
IHLGTLLYSTVKGSKLESRSRRRRVAAPANGNQYYPSASEEAWRILSQSKGRFIRPRNAVVGGVNKCEIDQCEMFVGYGGEPDEQGQTTLDAMVMDGATMNVGAVAGLNDINDAVLAARFVLERTSHTFLVGKWASDFAEQIGLKRYSTLATPNTTAEWQQWKENNCQRNFWQGVTPDPKLSCGPYKPLTHVHEERNRTEYNIGPDNHDTIGMVAIDVDHQMHTATSTNGLKYKIHGRVGDSPIAGAGSYADNEAGAALSTGDGDIMMRFLPSLRAVDAMREGKSPAQAIEQVFQRILKHYPNFFGALITVDRLGHYAGICHGVKTFPFIVSSPKRAMRLEIEIERLRLRCHCRKKLCMMIH